MSLGLPKDSVPNVVVNYPTGAKYPWRVRS